MSEIKLEPCPFCGGEAKMKHGYPRQQQKGMRQAVVQCKRCGCRTVTYALTREIYMLRKDILEGWKLNAEIEELDEEPKQISPTFGL